MKIKVYPDPEALSEEAARLFVAAARSSVQARGRFVAALSGGSSPRQTYERLASAPFKTQVPWQQTYLFWGDERFVPPDSPQNNARTARAALLDHVPIPSGHLFPVPTGGSPESAAGRYASTLASFFEDDLPRFDLIFLGLGTNGHTASLFPGTDVLEEQSRWVAPVYLEGQDQYRITLTLPVINNAENIVFLAYGSSKAHVLQQVLEGAYRPEELPAQLVHPSEGNLFWLIDDEAAGNRKHPADQ